MERFLHYASFLRGAGAVILYSLLVAHTTGCSKPQEFEYIDDITSSENGTYIIVTDENGVPGDVSPGTTVGVYVVNEDGSVTYLTVEADENGNAILPTSALGGNIVAYSPVQDEWGEAAYATPQMFTVKSDQSDEANYIASDLMMGSSATATRSEQSVMTFRHMMAKVAIHIIDEIGRTDLSQMEAELIAQKSAVMVDLARQSVATVRDLQTNVVMLSKMTTDWRVSSYAIVAPQTVTDGTPFFAVTLYGTRQTYTVPQDAVLEGGKTYTINMRLTEYGLIPDGWYITDWDDVGESMINIEIP